MSACSFIFFAYFLLQFILEKSVNPRKARKVSGKGYEIFRAFRVFRVFRGQFFDCRTNYLIDKHVPAAITSARGNKTQVLKMGKFPSGFVGDGFSQVYAVNRTKTGRPP